MARGLLIGRGTSLVKAAGGAVAIMAGLTGAVTVGAQQASAAEHYTSYIHVLFRSYSHPYDTYHLDPNMRVQLVSQSGHCTKLNAYAPVTIGDFMKPPSGNQNHANIDLGNLEIEVSGTCFSFDNPPKATFEIQDVSTGTALATFTVEKYVLLRDLAVSCVAGTGVDTCGGTGYRGVVTPELDLHVVFSPPA